MTVIHTSQFSLRPEARDPDRTLLINPDGASQHHNHGPPQVKSDCVVNGLYLCVPGIMSDLLSYTFTYIFFFCWQTHGFAMNYHAVTCLGPHSNRHLGQYPQVITVGTNLL